MARIAWVEDDDATGPLAEMYAQARARRVAAGEKPEVPEIIRAISSRPDFLRAVLSAGQLHFSAGALTVAQHEMIASYVSALNRCHY
jgi:hypothetical protein